MASSELTCVAAIADAHGVHGNVKIKSFTSDPAAFAVYGPLLNDKGETVLTPIKVRPVGRFFSLSVEEKMTREQVEAMKSTKLYVLRSALPEPDQDEFYYSDLIGMQVDNQDGEIVGIVQAVHEFGAGDTLEIKPLQGSNFYHPFTVHHAPTVDLVAQRIVIVQEEAEEARGDGAPAQVRANISRF